MGGRQRFSQAHVWKSRYDIGMSDFSLPAALGSALIGGFAGYIGSILNQDRTRRLDRKTFLRALEVEISILQEKLIAEKEFIREFSERGRMAVCLRESEPMIINDRDMLVFSSNTSKIGLFDHQTAHEIIHFYHNANVAKLRLEEWYRLTDEDDFIARGPYVFNDIYAAVAVSLGLWNKLDGMLCPWHVKFRTWCWIRREKLILWLGLKQADEELPPLR
jgi:hypothetical protein